MGEAVLLAVVAEADDIGVSKVLVVSNPEVVGSRVPVSPRSTNIRGLKNIIKRSWGDLPPTGNRNRSNGKEKVCTANAEQAEPVTVVVSMPLEYSSRTVVERNVLVVLPLTTEATTRVRAGW